MRKKLSITIEASLYQKLHRLIGRRRISQFIESLLQSCLMPKVLETEYRRMAQDQEREAEALAWADATVNDVADEAE